MYGAMSDKNYNTLSYKIPLGHRMLKELLRKQATVAWLHFLRASVFNKYGFEAQSEVNLPTTILAMYLPSISVVSSMKTQIDPFDIFSLILAYIFSYRSGK